MFLVIFRDSIYRKKTKIHYTIILICRLFFFTFVTSQLIAQENKKSFSPTISVNSIRSYNLRKLVKKGKKNKLSEKETLRGIIYSFDEKETIILSLIKFFIGKQEKEFSIKENDKDIIMQAALNLKPNTKYKVAIVRYLLKKNIYKRKRLIGQDPYSWSHIFHTLLSRLFDSIMAEPNWQDNYILGKIFRLDVAIVCFILLRIFQSKGNLYGSQNKLGIFIFFKNFGIVSGLFKIAFVVHNLLVILYAIRKMYRPGYLFLVLNQREYNASTHQIFKLLLQYGANSIQECYLFYVKKERQDFPALLKLYQIKVINPLHLAIKKNNKKAAELILKQNKQAIGTKAYIITDKTPATITPFDQKVTIQAIYNKVGNSQEQSCIKILLPKDFCLPGTNMEQLLLSYEEKYKAKTKQ